jgi:hypothetical protein
MRRITSILILTCVIVASVCAQAPQAFSFQAVVRDGDGQLISGKTVTVTLAILKDNPAGTKVYEETFQSLTDAAGVLSLSAGKGTPVSGKFTEIDWSTGTYYVKTSLRLPGDNQVYDMGTLQLLSVPYALYAEKSGSGGGDGGGDVWVKKVTNNNPVVAFMLPTSVQNPTTGKDIVSLGAVENYPEAGGVWVYANGQTKGSMVAGPQSNGNIGTIALYDQNSTMRIGLAADREKGYIGLNSSSGMGTNIEPDGITGYKNDVASYYLYTTAGGGGTLRLYDEKTVNNVALGSGAANEGGGIWTYNNGNYLVKISALQAAPTHGGIGVYDEKGEKGLLFTDLNGDGKLMLLGQNGNLNVGIGGADGALNSGGIWTKNPDGKDLVRITSLDNYTSNGAIVIFNATGEKGSFYVTSSGKSRLIVDEIYDNSGYSIRSATADYSLQTRSDTGGDPCYVTETGDNQLVVRGTATLQNGSYTVVLPREAAAKIRENTLTVQVTPLSAASKGLAVVRKEAGLFAVAELMSGTGSYAFDWTLTALRKNDPALRSQLSEETGASPADDRPVKLSDPIPEKTDVQRSPKLAFPNVEQ